MRPIRLNFLLICALLWMSCVSAPAFAQPREYVKDIAPGVQLLQTVDPDVPITISAVKFDTRKAGVRAGAFVGNNLINAKQREVVSSAVARTHALAGANADFFPWTCDPLGFTVVDGRLVSEPASNRPCIGFTTGGEPLIGDVKMALTLEMPNGRYIKLDGVDRAAGQADVILYDRLWGTSTGASADSAELILSCDWPQIMQTGQLDAQVLSLSVPGTDQRIPEGAVVLVAKGARVAELTSALSDQKTVKLRLVVQDGSNRSWLGVRNAVGGGSWLVRDGQVFENSQKAGFGASFAKSRHPRTAVGVTKTGSVLLLVVDGRQTVSRGASLAELAQIMMDRGCVQAINLDGGGSSSLVVEDLVINTPSDGQQRQVASGLLVFGTPLTMTSPTFSLAPATSQVTAGAGESFQPNPADSGSLTPAQMTRVLWGTKNGGGFVEQNGAFTGLFPGIKTVRARLAGSTDESLPAEADVAVLAKGPGAVTLSWNPVTPLGNAQRTLNIAVKDSAGNASAWATAAVSVTGGSANPASVVCGRDGLGQTTVTWDSSFATENRIVTVTCNAVSASTGDQ
ncbi:MAG: phosphodiester glycosidase family protein [Armatimonadetes bacterium]|nr:phosphodiester glycosidase family protein [Armatimonadota bacterium]